MISSHNISIILAQLRWNCISFGYELPVINHSSNPSRYLSCNYPPLDVYFMSELFCELTLYRFSWCTKKRHQLGQWSLYLRTSIRCCWGVRDDDDNDDVGVDVGSSNAMNLSNMPSNIKCTLDISTGSYRVDYVVIHKTIPITSVYKKFQK